MYFETLTGSRNKYLSKQPKKAEALKNATVDGITSILPDSNNRAIIIKTDNTIILQSYDAQILSYNRVTGEITKLYFDNCTKTTLKHINTFLALFADRAPINKKAWDALQ